VLISVEAPASLRCRRGGAHPPAGARRQGQL